LPTPYDTFTTREKMISKLQKLQLRTLAALLVTALSSSAVAQTLGELRSRRDALERELSQINEAIAKQESEPEGGSSAAARWFIKRFGIDEVNSAGGVEPYIVFFNPNEASEIKYAVVRVTLYNAVGDVVSSTIGGESTVSLKFTGPLSHGEGEKRADWGPAWYNPTGHCVKIESVTVTFMNGKSAAFSGKSLRAALAPNLSNECQAKRR
jgi:hypothetical protein